MSGLVEALGKLAHLGRQRLDRCAGHGLLQQQADLGESVTQRADRPVDRAERPESLDADVDFAKPLLEPR